MDGVPFHQNETLHHSFSNENICKYKQTKFIRNNLANISYNLYSSSFDQEISSYHRYNMKILTLIYTALGHQTLLYSTISNIWYIKAFLANKKSKSRQQKFCSIYMTVLQSTLTFSHPYELHCFPQYIKSSQNQFIYHLQQRLLLPINK